MSVQHALLGLLERSPKHGYELKHQFDTVFSPDRPLPFGQVYASLARLQRDGRVVVDGIERVDGPDRIRYSITNDGHDALARWLAEPLEPAPHLQAELYTKVVLAIILGQPLDDLLDAQRHAHLERMRELTALRRGSPLPTTLLADYATFHLEADLRWIEMTAARVGELRERLAPEERR
jgi:DNA-binding PadR family transcriptional regulator